jgi:3-methyl-2-oxobutanoate hydroxymethyltransferase
VSTQTAPTHAVTVPGLLQKKQRHEAITVLTAYDASFARIFDDAGVDVLLVGDSLGMVIQGHENTLPVTVEDMLYHTRAVRRGSKRALVVADMPYLSYHGSLQEAVHNAGRMLKEGGAQAVKLEGGAAFVDVVRALVRASIPVMGHLGLMPQSVHAMGGYKVQAKTEEGRRQLLADALALQEAGCFSLVLEGIPADLAEEVSKSLEIPTIGIGAGVGCDGQVLVCYDLLGMNPDFSPKFVKHYEDLYHRIRAASEAYCAEVRARTFPEKIHSFASPQLVRVKNG